MMSILCILASESFCARDSFRMKSRIIINIMFEIDTYALSSHANEDLAKRNTDERDRSIFNVL